MANITVNTQSAAYLNRHQQFKDIVTFWKPLLIEYFRMDEEQQAAWRQNDPFLADILKLVRAVVTIREDEL